MTYELWDVPRGILSRGVWAMLLTLVAVECFLSQRALGQNTAPGPTQTTEGLQQRVGELEGEVAKPKTLDIDAIMKLAPLEERIYRHRCVEGWSIVVPWIGFSLSTLLKQVEPTSKAKYVAFETYYDPKQMPLGKYAGAK